MFYTPFNDSIQRQTPYGLLGARVEYGPGNRRWTIGAYARNLTNTDYVTGTSVRRPRHSPDVPDPRVSLQLISPYGDKSGRHHGFGVFGTEGFCGLRDRACLLVRGRGILDGVSLRSRSAEMT